MTSRQVNNEEDAPDPCEVIPQCPICNGRMEKVYDRYHQRVCVCVDCHTGLTIPANAVNVAKMKRSKESA
jgi:hypothetical protein